MGAQGLDAAAAGGDSADDGDSLDLILTYARQSYDLQFARHDAYRARSGTLLAFAAVLVALSAGSVTAAPPGKAHVAGTGAVLVAAVVFMVASSGSGLQLVPSARWVMATDVADPAATTKRRLLRSLTVAIESNQRALRRLSTLLSVGLLWLLVGTILIGVRLTLLLR